MCPITLGIARGISAFRGPSRDSPRLIAIEVGLAQVWPGRNRGDVERTYTRSGEHREFCDTGQKRGCQFRKADAYHRTRARGSRLRSRIAGSMSRAQPLHR